MKREYVLPTDEAVIVSREGGTCLCGNIATQCLLKKRCSETHYCPTAPKHICSKECQEEYVYDTYCNRHCPELVVCDEMPRYIWTDEPKLKKQTWKRELEWNIKEKPTKRVLVFE
jgi:hypothetical protein